MKHWRFDGIYTASGWVTPGFVTVDASGRIIALSDTQPARATPAEIYNVRGYALPGFPNAHSHVFQYAMAGRTEYIAKQHERDDFWSWREAMYTLAGSLDPEQLQAIAAMGYAEMLRLGITHVAEFHYLHHDKNGAPYRQKNEMSARLLAAAAATGIKLTLLPMYYKNGGFDQPAQARQKRFITKDVDAYLELAADVRSLAAKAYPEAHIGIGVHSLRAASQADAKTILQAATDLGPIHIHAAEQDSEVKACIAAWGARPVEWILDNGAAGPRLSIVHATHLDKNEIACLAKSKANVVICPSTEANLGDGVFPLLDYQRAGGQWCIGTDSHIGLNFAEELRWLDYTHRLRLETRNPLAQPGGMDSASSLFNTAVASGRVACGLASRDWLGIGDAFDAVIVDSDAPIMAGREHSELLASYIYASDSSTHLGTIINGQWCVQRQKHRRYEQIRSAYHQVMKSITLQRS